MPDAVKIPSRRSLKRIGDIIIALAGIVFALPVVVVAGAAIKAEDGGSALYIQERVGRMGVPFKIFKLRTMSEGSNGAEIAVSGDSRITGIGAFLRQYKIDELPQLVNVLRGEMSIVGPRPEIPLYVELYTSGNMEALTSRPGITDPASLMFRNEGERLLALGGDPSDAYIGNILQRKLALSIFYQRHATILSDMKVILCTLKPKISVCGSKGTGGVF